MYLCLCKGITESDLHRAAPTCDTSPQALIKTLGLDDEDCCGRCVENIDELMGFASDRCARCPLATSHSDRLDTSSPALQ